MKGRQNFGVLFFFRGFYFFSEQVIARFDKRLQKKMYLYINLLTYGYLF